MIKFNFNKYNFLSWNIFISYFILLNLEEKNILHLLLILLILQIQKKKNLKSWLNKNLISFLK
jgi:hypothetical protein